MGHQVHLNRIGVEFSHESVKLAWSLELGIKFSVDGINRIPNSKQCDFSYNLHT